MIKTDRFKTISIEIMFRNDVKKEEITLTNFLASILSYTTKEYPTRNSLACKMQDLYSAKMFPTCYRIGNFYNMDFNMSILNPKYSEEGMLEESLELLKNVIFSPNVQDGKFDSTSFEVIKNEEKTQIERIREDARKYSMIRMLQNLTDKEVFSYTEFGYMEDLLKITPSNLYDFYKKIMNNSVIDIFIVGDIDFSEIETIIKDKFKFRVYKNDKKSPILDNFPYRKKPQTIFEQDNTNQAKLSIGCVIDNMTKFEREYVLNIYNLILGATADSKFFKNIREKYSICYYVSSIGNKLDNLLLISSGIAKENFDIMISLINKEMKDMEKGEFSELDVENAKKYYISVLEEAEDRPNQIISSYYATELWNVDSLEKRKKEVTRVSKDDIANLAKKIHIDTIFLLGGDKK